MLKPWTTVASELGSYPGRYLGAEPCLRSATDFYTVTITNNIISLDIVVSQAKDISQCRYIYWIQMFACLFIITFGLSTQHQLGFKC